MLGNNKAALSALRSAVQSDMRNLDAVILLASVQTGERRTGRGT